MNELPPNAVFVGRSSLVDTLLPKKPELADLLRRSSGEVEKLRNSTDFERVYQLVQRVGQSHQEIVKNILEKAAYLVGDPDKLDDWSFAVDRSKRMSELIRSDDRRQDSEKSPAGLFEDMSDEQVRRIARSVVLLHQKNNAANRRALDLVQHFDRSMDEAETSWELRINNDISFMEQILDDELGSRRFPAQKSKALKGSLQRVSDVYQRVAEIGEDGRRMWQMASQETGENGKEIPIEKFDQMVKYSTIIQQFLVIDRTKLPAKQKETLRAYVARDVLKKAELMGVAEEDPIGVLEDWVINGVDGKYTDVMIQQFLNWQGYSLDGDSFADIQKKAKRKSHRRRNKVLATAGLAVLMSGQLRGDRPSTSSIEPQAVGIQELYLPTVSADGYEINLIDQDTNPPAFISHREAIERQDLKENPPRPEKQNYPKRAITETMLSHSDAAISYSWSYNDDREITRFTGDDEVKWEVTGEVQDRRFRTSTYSQFNREDWFPEWLKNDNNGKHRQIEYPDGYVPFSDRSTEDMSTLLTLTTYTDVKSAINLASISLPVPLGYEPYTGTAIYKGQEMNITFSLANDGTYTMWMNGEENIDGKLDNTPMSIRVNLIKADPVLTLSNIQEPSGMEYREIADDEVLPQKVQDQLEKFKAIQDEAVRADAIQSYIREYFTFSANPTFSRIYQQSDSRNRYVELLFKGRHGNLPEVSVAMVDVLRTTGIPARMVSGFGNIGNTSDNILSGSDQTVWVEAWVDGEWIELNSMPYQIDDFTKDRMMGNDLADGLVPIEYRWHHESVLQENGSGGSELQESLTGEPGKFEGEFSGFPQNQKDEYRPENSGDRLNEVSDLILWRIEGSEEQAQGYYINGTYSDFSSYDNTWSARFVDGDNPFIYSDYAESLPEVKKKYLQERNWQRPPEIFLNSELPVHSTDFYTQNDRKVYSVSFTPVVKEGYEIVSSQVLIKGQSVHASYMLLNDGKYKVYISESEGGDVFETLSSVSNSDEYLQIRLGMAPMEAEMRTIIESAKPWGGHSDSLMDISLLPRSTQEEIENIRLIEDDALKLAELHEFINQHFTYSLDSEISDWYHEARNSYEFIERIFIGGKGDCDVINTVGIAVLRELGIPARMRIGFNNSGGFLDTDSMVLSGDEAHGWAEAYVNGKWVRADFTPSSMEQETKAKFEEAGRGDMVESVPVYSDSGTEEIMREVMMQLQNAEQLKQENPASSTIIQALVYASLLIANRRKFSSLRKKFKELDTEIATQTRGIAGYSETYGSETSVNTLVRKVTKSADVTATSSDFWPTYGRLLRHVFGAPIDTAILAIKGHNLKKLEKNVARTGEAINTPGSEPDLGHYLSSLAGKDMPSANQMIARRNQEAIRSEFAKPLINVHVSDTYYYLSETRLRKIAKRSSSIEDFARRYERYVRIDYPFFKAVNDSLHVISSVFHRRKPNTFMGKMDAIALKELLKSPKYQFALAAYWEAIHQN